MTFTRTLIIFLIVTTPLFAGDAATFINLGFSPDGSFYAFGQYGYYDGSGFPYGEIFIIDVKKNNYVKGGVIKVTVQDENGDFEAVSDFHAFLDAYGKAVPLLKQCHILVTSPGIEHRAKEAATSIHWREKGSPRSVTLVEKKTPAPDGEYYSDKASFHILLKDKGNQYTLGNINRVRAAVYDYGLPRVFCSANGKAIVSIVSKMSFGFEGPDTRFMAETWYEQ